MTKNKWNRLPKEARCLLSQMLHSERQVIITLKRDETVKFEDWWYACSVLFLALYSGGERLLFFFLVNIFTNTQIMAELLYPVMKKSICFYLLIKL